MKSIALALQVGSLVGDLDDVWHVTWNTLE